MVISENSAPDGIQNGVNPLVAHHHIHNPGRTGIGTGNPPVQVSGQPAFLFLDNILSAWIQPAHRLLSLPVHIGGIDETVLVNLHAGELRRDKKLLPGSLFLGGKSSPENLPGRNLHINGSRKSQKHSRLVKGHNALKLVLGNDIHTVRIIHCHLQGAEHISLFQNIGLWILDHLYQVPSAVQFHHPHIVGIRNVQIPPGGYINPVGRGKRFLLPVPFKLLDNLNQVELPVRDHNAVVVGVRDVDISRLIRIQILGSRQVPASDLRPCDNAVRHIGRRSVLDIFIIIVIVSLIGHVLSCLHRDSRPVPQQHRGSHKQGCGSDQGTCCAAVRFPAGFSCCASTLRSAGFSRCVSAGFPAGFSCCADSLRLPCFRGFPWGFPEKQSVPYLIHLLPPFLNPSCRRWSSFR